jgi:hypothetical protein
MNDNIPSINSLHREKFIKETSKIDIYNIVINKCVEKIVYTNRHTDKTYIIFEIPKILIGYPNYDMKSCILFVINKLSQSGYMIEFIEPFYLYIDWGSPVNKINNNLNMKINALKTNNTEKLRAQTKALLSQFPNTSNVEFVYEDALISKKNSSKKNKKNKNKKK